MNMNKNSNNKKNKKCFPHVWRLHESTTILQTRTKTATTTTSTTTTIIIINIKNIST